MMELAQLLSIVKLLCSNDVIRGNNAYCSSSAEHEVILYQFSHWCFVNKFNYDSIQSDIYNPNRHDSLVYQWFRRHQSTQIYNHLADVIINNQQTQTHPMICNDHRDPYVANNTHPTMHHHAHCESYHSSNTDEDSDGLVIAEPNTTDTASTNYKYSDYYCECIDINDICMDKSYEFSVSIHTTTNHTFTVEYSLFELIIALQSLPLSTVNAVWQKIPKNEDEVIGDKQNLCLCLHILICISIKNKYKNSDESNEYNAFQNDPIYLNFLDGITTTLCLHYVARSIRIKLNPKCLPLRDSQSSSEIAMGFGDLVEELPKWLKQCNDDIVSH
eukprot:285645_1